MLNTMINSSVTMGQLQHKMDTISNNMANLDTAGFKRKEVSFNELLVQEFKNQPREDKEIGRQTPYGIRQGVGAALAQAKLMMEQGSVKMTERALDIAITGPNQFFRVMTEGEGVSLTRDGKFYLSPNQNDPDNPGLHLVTGSGDFVQGKDGPIVLPADAKEVVVSKSGEVSAINAQGNTIAVGQLNIISVIRPQLLSSVGENKFRLPDNLEALNLTQEQLIQETNVGEISLQQGAIEMSNVDMSKEMTELMMTQKSYQFNAQALRMSNDMFGLINQLR